MSTGYTKNINYRSLMNFNKTLTELHKFEEFNNYVIFKDFNEICILNGASIGKIIQVFDSVKKTFDMDSFMNININSINLNELPIDINNKCFQNMVNIDHLKNLSYLKSITHIQQLENINYIKLIASNEINLDSLSQLDHLQNLSYLNNLENLSFIAKISEYNNHNNNNISLDNTYDFAILKCLECLSSLKCLTSLECLASINETPIDLNLANLALKDLKNLSVLDGLKDFCIYYYPEKEPEFNWSNYSTYDIRPVHNIACVNEPHPNIKLYSVNNKHKLLEEKDTQSDLSELKIIFDKFNEQCNEHMKHHKVSAKNILKSYKERRTLHDYDHDNFNSDYDPSMPFDLIKIILTYHGYDQKLLHVCRAMYGHILKNYNHTT
jgi:hypothetical protein